MLVIFAGVFLLASQVVSAQTLKDSTETQNNSNKGELIISIEANNEDKDSLYQNSQMSTLEQKGFHVADSMINSLQAKATTMNVDFQETVARNMGYVYLIEYSKDTYQNDDQAKEDLKKTLEAMDLKVRYVQENQTMYAFEQSTDQVLEPTDVHPDQEWHYDMIRAPEAWNTTPGSSQTKIAVLDTGIDSQHNNLRDYVDTDAGESFVGGNTDDVQGHGTHVAGTIASYGNVSGVMQEATLIPVKVLGDDGSGSTYGIQQGILHAANEGADVINMSLGGGGYDQGMEEAIETATSEGTIVLAASGNDGMQNVSYPAAYDEAIAVGSVDSNKQRSSFSNYGPELDIMAPGSNIYSTVPGNGYDTLSGTSMATPHAAGVAGLIRATNPDISVNEARNILTGTAQDAGSSNEYGHGIIDANAAVQEANSGNGGEDPGEPDDPEDPEDPEVPEWEAYTLYEVGDVVTYNDKEYVCEIAHFSFPGWEPPHEPFYWSEK